MGYSSELTLENDWLLQKEPFEGLVGKVLVNKFEWLGFAPKVRLDGAESIAWATELYSADNDPEKRFPRRLTSGSDFVRVSSSKLTEGQATLAKWGFEFQIDERARRYKTNLDVMARQLKRQSNWLGEWQNARIISTLIGAGGITDAPGAGSFASRVVVKWNVAGANPVNDMILLKGDFEDSVNGYTATDFFVSRSRFRDALSYLIKLDVDMETRRSLFGVATAGQDSIYVPVLGATLHSVRVGLNDGDIIVMDSGMSPFTIYYDFNPEYGPAQSFTMENGDVLDNNFGLHTNQYYTDKNHEFIKQLWLENVIAVKDASAGMKQLNGATGI